MKIFVIIGHGCTKPSAAATRLEIAKRVAEQALGGKLKWRKAPYAERWDCDGDGVSIFATDLITEEKA